MKFIEEEIEDEKIKTWCCIDAMSLPDYDMFNDIEKQLEQFGLELLMNDQQDDSYWVKVIKNERL